MLALGAVALFAPTMAFGQTEDSKIATLELNGSIPVECSLSLGESGSSAVENVDLTEGRLTNQDMPDIEYGCNAPYTLTVKSENGGLLNTSIPDASGSDYEYTIRYGLNFNGIPTGATGGENGLDQYELGLTVSTPFVIVDQDWAAIGDLVEQTSVLNVEVDLGAGGATDGEGNYLAGEYQDTLTFEITGSL